MRSRAVDLLLPLIVGVVNAGCSQSGSSARHGPAERYQGEQAPAFRASSIVPWEVLVGPDYRIEEKVPVADYMYLFTIRTNYGVIPARGRDMLALRLQEMAAIQRARRLSEANHIAEGAKESLEKTGQGLNELLMDPGGTILRAPAGFNRMIKEELDSSDRRAGSEGRRRVAAMVGCDPETQNPVLKKLLDRMGLEQKIGGLITGQALDAALPGVGLLATTAEVTQLVATTAPHEINARIEQEFAMLGVSEALRKKFCGDMNYTTMQRLFFLTTLRRLRGVGNLSVLVQAAVEVVDEAEGLAAMHEANMLAELHARRPIARLDLIGLPVAVLRDGQCVCVCAADYLTNTREMQDLIGTFRKAYPKASATFVVVGRASAAAKQSFAAAGITVAENGSLGR
jgi:hypothetical protein